MDSSYNSNSTMAAPSHSDCKQEKKEYNNDKWARYDSISSSMDNAIFDILDRMARYKLLIMNKKQNLWIDWIPIIGMFTVWSKPHRGASAWYFMAHGFYSGLQTLGIAIFLTYKILT